MSYIDSAILNFTERCCRKFQRLTGRTNVWLAFQLTNLSIVLYFVGAGIYFWLSGGAARLAIAVFCGALLYLLIRTVFAVPVETSESSAYQRVAKGLRNPRRVRDAPLRIVFLTMSLLLGYPIALVYTNLGLILPLLSYSLIILTTAVLYLLACDPLPPCPGKLREWIEALAVRVARAPNSVASVGANRVRRRRTRELETACRSRRLNAINVGADPVYDKIRDHPRFRKLLEQTGLHPFFNESAQVQ